MKGPHRTAPKPHLSFLLLLLLLSALGAEGRNKERWSADWKWHGARIYDSLYCCVHNCAWVVAGLWSLLRKSFLSFSSSSPITPVCVPAPFFLLSQSPRLQVKRRCYWNKNNKTRINREKNPTPTPLLPNYYLCLSAFQCFFGQFCDVAKMAMIYRERAVFLKIFWGQILAIENLKKHLILALLK